MAISSIFGSFRQSSQVDTGITTAITYNCFLPHSWQLIHHNFGIKLP